MRRTYATETFFRIGFGQGIGDFVGQTHIWMHDGSIGIFWCQLHLGNLYACGFFCMHCGYLIPRYSLLLPHCIPDRQCLFSTSHIKNSYIKHMTTTISSFQYRDTKLHHAKLRISHSSTNVHEMALNMQTKVAQQVHPAKPRAIPPLHVATGF